MVGARYDVQVVSIAVITIWHRNGIEMELIIVVVAFIEPQYCRALMQIWVWTTLSGQIDDPLLVCHLCQISIIRMV